ncbi:MAG: phosphoesterase [Gammaproteobacteria bacterium]|nr:MAG: phosphoesterase [Gammaproteobacteria bacterium]
MNRVRVLYHGGRCLDGFGAAWAAWMHFRTTETAVDYQAMSHGDPVPEVAGETVYLLDYCLKREPLQALCESASRVVVLDHHESAAKDVAGLDEVCTNLALHFDMHRSGAVIAWEYFHTEPVPVLLEWIQDRDLWAWQWPESRDATAALMARPYDFGLWQALAEDEDARQTLVSEGAAINRFRQQMIEHYRKRAVMGTVAGYRVPVVNAPVEIQSELLGELAVGHPFAAGYLDREGRRGWSLRSTADGLNVADIARRFGGGGHPRAAGFSTPLPDDNFSVNP